MVRFQKLDFCPFGISHLTAQRSHLHTKTHHLLESIPQTGKAKLGKKARKIRFLDQYVRQKEGLKG